MIPQDGRGRKQLAAYAAVIAVAALGVFRLELTVNRLDQVVADNDAQHCVDSWASHEQIREAIAIPGEAIIDVATDADPEQVDQFRAAVDRRIKEALPNPDCDLDTARAQLND